MKMGVNVKWKYIHQQSKRFGGARTQRTKYGQYWGRIRHTRRYNGPQLAAVFFDGNKRISRVPYDELELVDPPEEKGNPCQT